MISTLCAVTTQAILYVRDLEPLAAFYRDCIGLAPADAGDGYCGLRGDGLVLWLVRGRQSPGADINPDGSLQPRSEVPIKLAFEVESIEQIRGSVESLGGSLAKAGWDFAGYHRRDVLDPEGNVVQLLEPLP